MSEDEWKQRTKAIDEKIAKEIRPLVVSLMEEFGLNEGSAYGLITELSGKRWSIKTPPTVDDNLIALEKTLKELDKVVSLVWNEKHSVQEKISQLKTKSLQENKFFSGFRWEIEPSKELTERITIEADEESVDKHIEELDYYFGSDYDRRAELYSFDSGESISFYYDRDDSVFHITMSLKEISVDEYLRAFETLGIKISFNDMEKYIKYEKKKFKKYEELVRKFERQSGE